MLYIFKIGFNSASFVHAFIAINESTSICLGCNSLFVWFFLFSWGLLPGQFLQSHSQNESLRGRVHFPNLFLFLLIGTFLSIITLIPLWCARNNIILQRATFLENDREMEVAHSVAATAGETEVRIVH